MKAKVESFDDIVFETRNKDYGAYELRTKYPKRAVVALIISLVILSFAVGVPLIASILRQRAYNKYLEKSTIAEMANLKEIKRDEVIAPPPPPPPPEVKEIKFIAPKIVDSLSTEEVELATADDLSESVNAGPVDTSTHIVEEVIVEEVAPVVEQVFESFAIQEKPSFPGGDAALIEYVAKNTKYPVVALENGIEGTVYIRFVVTKTGEVGDAKVMRTVDPLLEEEALRVVKSLPRWTPGKNNGNPVNVWFIIPVKFVLQ